MRTALGLAIAAFISTASQAGPVCTDAPRAKWLSESAFMAQMAADGRKVDVFKTTAGNCYEVYGRDAEGRRVEIYFDPVTGGVVKQSVR